jgi:hypothetical protein
MWLIRLKGIFAAHFLMCLLSNYSYADEQPQPLYEQKIKAGLVYNLLKYTEWPQVSIAPKADNKVAENPGITKLQICLFGDDPFDGYLSPLEGRTAQQATITIIHVTEVQQTEHCNAVIIHRNQAQQLNPLLQFLRGKNVLTISDIAKFAEQGGMVEMTRQDEKIALHINKESVDLAKLIIDARMLKLATIVSGKGGA